jgi:hypothetical protein
MGNIGMNGSERVQKGFRKGSEKVQRVQRVQRVQKVQKVQEIQEIQKVQTE